MTPYKEVWPSPYTIAGVIISPARTSLLWFCGSPWIIIQLNNFSKLPATGIEPLIIGRSPTPQGLPNLHSYLLCFCVLHKYSHTNLLTAHPRSSKRRCPLRKLTFFSTKMRNSAWIRKQKIKRRKLVDFKLQGWVAQLVVYQ